MEIMQSLQKQYEFYLNYHSKNSSPSWADMVKKKPGMG